MGLDVMNEGYHVYNLVFELLLSLEFYLENFLRTRLDALSEVRQDPVVTEVFLTRFRRRRHKFIEIDNRGQSLEGVHLVVRQTDHVIFEFHPA